MASPPFPTELSHAWLAWRRIRKRTRPGPSGPSPITWEGIDAFMRRSLTDLSPSDIECIEIIDDAYLASLSSGPSEAEGQTALRDGLKSAGRKPE